MSFNNNFKILNSTIQDGLTKAQQVRLYEYERKQRLKSELYVQIYNCYKKGVNVFDAHERDAIIIETATNAKRLLHNYNITTAYLFDIYAKTCVQVIKELKQAEANAPPPLQIQIKEDEDIKQYAKIIKYSLYIAIIVYTIILIL